MKCTDVCMNLVLENVMKRENFQIFHCMKSFHDVQTAFSYSDGNEFFAHFYRTAYMKPELGNCIQISTKNRFKTEYFTRKREREVDNNAQFFRRSLCISLKKLLLWAHWLGPRCGILS